MVTHTLERILILDLGLAVTIQTRIYKNIKNVKRCREWHAERYANKVGMMHESKGQHIAITECSLQSSCHSKKDKTQHFH